MDNHGTPSEIAHLPICPKRKLPIPFIAEIEASGIGNFGVLDYDRALECLHSRLCAMCGRSMGTLIAFLGDRSSLKRDGFWIEPPIHERCAEIVTGGLCPFISNERVPRRELTEGMAIIGTTPEQLSQVGRDIAKRSWVMAITKTYRAELVPAFGGSVSVVYVTDAIEYVRSFSYDENGRLTETSR